MRITDRFRSEHAVFLEQIVVLRSMLDGGEPIDAVVAGIRTLAAPLGRHAEREEDALFPALSSDAAGLIRVLTEEHALIEGSIDRMKSGLTPVALRSVFDTFAETLRGHIVREDDVLFPMAERALPEDALVVLDEGTVRVPAWVDA